MARIDVKKIYGIEDEKEFLNCYLGYEDMVEAFGRRLLAASDTDSSEGDSYRLIADGDEPDQRYGILIFGWGSCSGCDALEGCSYITEVQELANDLQDSIKWFPNKEALREYVQSHDWQGDYVWYYSDFKEFHRLVVEFLDSDRE
jgi:hypothetical protein